jgi:hypothetical protein
VLRLVQDDEAVDVDAGVCKRPDDHRVTLPGRSSSSTRRRSGTHFATRQWLVAVFIVGLTFLILELTFLSLLGSAMRDD